LPAGPTVILCLKIAVVGVTLLLLASLVALLRRNYRLHGRINIAFFTLTMIAVCVFEGMLQFGVPVTRHFSDADRLALKVHLWFVVPLIPVMILMLVTGLRHKGRVHVSLAGLFAILWLGTFISGVFFLPHAAP
jgi:uncharacterized membrane protein YozB (DUF420 family)